MSASESGSVGPGGSAGARGSGGSAGSSAREEMLARVRAARGSTPVVEPARDYREVGDRAAGSAALIDLLEERLVDYKATVRRCDAAGLPAAIAAALAEAGVTEGSRVVVPPGLPEGWVVGGVQDRGMSDDHASDGDVPGGRAMTAYELDGCAAVVTACRVACAETGTIALDGELDQGRRAITLVPDVHVCVVRADQVVESVPELIARLDARRPLTLISGPSATSDIELDRVEGVHGPRTLSVVLVTG